MKKSVEWKARRTVRGPKYSKDYGLVNVGWQRFSHQKPYSLSLSLFLDFRFAFNQTQIMFSAWFREFGALGLKRWWVQIRNQGSFWLRFSTGLILNNIVKSMRASLSRKFNADEEWVLQWKLCWALIIFL